MRPSGPAVDESRASLFLNSLSWASSTSSLVFGYVGLRNMTKVS